MLLRLGGMILSLMLTICVAQGQDLLDGPECVSYDTVGNRYLVSSLINGRIVEIDESGNQRYLEGDYGTVLGNCLDGDTLYFSMGTNIIGLDITTEEQVAFIPVAGSQQLDGMTVDTSGNLYVADFVIGGSNNDHIYKIPLDTRVPEIFVGAEISDGPQDIIFDAENNRLLVGGYSTNAPIQAVSLPDGVVTDLVITPFGNIDGLAWDGRGNYFVSCYTEGTIYIYDETFTNPPTVFATGFQNPSNICYNRQDDIMAVPNFEGDRVDLVPAFVSYSADTTWGWAPLEVSFTASSHWDVDVWNWMFGDGESSELQSPVHEYLAPGMFDITITVDADGVERSFTHDNYIIALADSLAGDKPSVEPDLTAVMILSARNTVPLRKINIPVEYGGAMGLTLDSVSTVGCRTESMEQVEYFHYDPTNHRATVTLLSNDDALYLAPGDGPVLKLHFSVPPSTPSGQIVSVLLDGYTYYEPQFEGMGHVYTPVCTDGMVLMYACGDPNGDVDINLLDVLFLIDFLYGNPQGPAPVPSEAGDANADYAVNLLDILYLIDHLYGTPTGPAPVCP